MEIWIEDVLVWCGLVCEMICGEGVVASSFRFRVGLLEGGLMKEWTIC